MCFPHFPSFFFQSSCTDLLDILSVLVEISGKPHQSHVTPPSVSLHSDDVGMIMERSNEFKLHSIRERQAKNKSHTDPFVTVALTDPIQTAVNHFTKGHVHRLAVVDAKGKLVNVMTQSDILAWAAKDIPTRLNDPCVEAHTLMTVPFAVKDSEAAIDAFCVLESRHFSGAPVVDKDGVLVGSLSTSDLKQLNQKSFLNLLE